MNPFNWSAVEFLTLYAVLLVVAWLFSLGVSWGWWGPLRGQNQARSVPTPSQNRALGHESLALMMGGPARLMESTVTALLVRNHLGISGDQLVVQGKPDEQTSRAERTVLAQPSPFFWHELPHRLEPVAKGMAHELRNKGYMKPEELLARVRLWQAMPFLLLLAFGLVRCALGVSREAAIGFLVFFLVVTGVCALIRLRTSGVSPLTQAGEHALQDALISRRRLKQAPTQAEMPLAVALFGTSVLAGSALAPFLVLLEAGRDAGGSSDSGSHGNSDGGTSSAGGCGGGGCGGCGGGGD